MRKDVKVALGQKIQKEYANIAGLAIIKDGQCVYQYHDNKSDKHQPVHVASVTKSIVSILIGIAIKHDYIGSVTDKVIDYFPHYKMKRGEKTLPQIQLQHLLTMTAPYKCQHEPYTKIYSSDDWTQSSLDLLGGRGDIGTFRYTTAPLQVLSGVIANSTGQSLRSFATEHLFIPLDMTVSEDIKINGKEDYFSFMKDPVPSGWIIGPEGNNTAGWGLTLSAMEMAKVGQLVLQQGEYKGHQIVPQHWIKESTRQHSQWEHRAYGYLWWLIDQASETYAAMGDSGNILYISEQEKLVISITSYYMPRAKDRLTLIKECLLPLL